ncbi:MAG: peptidoglycan-binding domain-containing protein [Candidatus Pacebacteria bacterium]|nr:peptidoglycan-binding domain-containing protein [Candidatus Paceibacterota bacterium]
MKTHVARSIAAAVIVSVLPLSAAAQSTTDISAVLAQITTLEQQIKLLTGSSSTATSTPSTPAPSSTPSTQASCPDLSRTLSLGISGADVSGLQVFLAQEGYFNGLTTGYFGSLTQASVAAWQEKNGIVTGGDANSTGLGVVGPKTRAAMEAACAPGQGTTPAKAQCIPAHPPTLECSTQWQPVLDANGCSSYYQCTVQLPQSSTPTSSNPSATSSAPVTCPFVQKPTCSGTVTPFQTNANGCVISYQCSI